MEPRIAIPARITSNVLRTDYAGSATCADCHADLYKACAASPMRYLTRDAATASIVAPFDGASLRAGPDVSAMETVGGQRMMRMDLPLGSHRFKNV